MLNNSITFGGLLKDKDLMKIIGVNRDSFYRWKKELKAEYTEKVVKKIGKEESKSDIDKKKGNRK